MDSLEILEALAYARSAQGTPVVVITKHTSEEGVLRAMEAGAIARAYIRKPFTVKDLSRKLSLCWSKNWRLPSPSSLGCPQPPIEGVLGGVPGRKLFWKSTIDDWLARV